MTELEAILKQTKDFETDCRLYNYDTTYQEFKFSRGAKVYNNILKRLKEIKLPDPKTFQYTTLTIEELKSYIQEILDKIFSSRYTNTISEYNDLITLEEIPNAFEATLESDVQGDTHIIKKFYLSNKLASIEIVAAAHEYIHALLSKHITTNFNRVISNIHYRELLSILIEYITIYELSELLKQDKLETKHNIIRIQNCQDHARTLEENHQLLIYTNKVLQNPELVSGIKQCITYAEHNAFGYIVSNIYALKLFTYYQDDPQSLISFFTAIIDGEQSISNLLKYYNLDLRNKETLEPFNLRLEKAKK